MIRLRRSKGTVLPDGCEHVGGARREGRSWPPVVESLVLIVAYRQAAGEF